MPKISVIVPVYNTEKYLRRCIDSILAQTFTDFELLLVDDGSKDDSCVICDEYAKKDPRVRVFHKENGGVSSARNLGLDEAKGEWIAFVDSDDWVENDFLEFFSPTHKDELIIQSFSIIEEQGRKSHVSQPGNIFEVTEISDVIEKETGLNWAAITIWAKLFCRDLIESQKLRFKKSLSLGEDVLFSLSYIANIDRLRTVDATCYCYNNIKEEGKNLSVRALPILEFMEYVDAIVPVLEALEQKGSISSKEKMLSSNLNGYMRRTRIWIVGSRISVFKKIGYFKQLYNHKIVRTVAENIHLGREHWYICMAKAHMYGLMTLMSIWSNRKTKHDYYID